MEAFLDTLLEATGLNAEALDRVDDAHRDEDTRVAPVSVSPPSISIDRSEIDPDGDPSDPASIDRTRGKSTGVATSLDRVSSSRTHRLGRLLRLSRPSPLPQRAVRVRAGFRGDDRAADEGGTGDDERRVQSAKRHGICRSRCAAPVARAR